MIPSRPTFAPGGPDAGTVPSRHQLQHAAGRGSALFSFSDRPVGEILRRFPEDRGNA